MTTAAIYLRLSNDDGRKGESQSIGGQREDTTAYARRQGWQVVEYVDDGLSASRGLDRPQYLAMVDAMVAGDVQVVLASKQDRLTRNEKEWFEFAGYATLANVEVHTCEAGALNLNTEVGMLNAGMRNIYAAFEARLISNRTKRGYESSRAKGGWTASATFGYGPKGVVREDQAKMVRWAYDQILNHNMSSRAVWEYFRANGVKTARGNDFPSVGAVITMLRNPALAGLNTYKGEIIGKGNWEPIVTPEERDQMIAAMAARRISEKAHGKRRARKYALAGLVLCGNPSCDLKVMAAQNPGAGRWHYFYCDPRRGGCTKRVKGQQLDEVAVMVANQFLQTWAPPSVTPKGFDESEAGELQARLAEVRSMMVSGDMRASDAAPVLRGLNERLDAVKAIKAAQAEQDARLGAWHSERLQAITDENGVPNLEIRTILDNVVVLPGDKAGFRWESKTGQIHETPILGEGRGWMTVRVV